MAKAGRARVDLGVDHVRGHHGRQHAVQPAVGLGVVGQDGLEAAAVDGGVGVRIGTHEAVAGEVLAAVGHAGLQQALGEPAPQHGDHARVARKSAVADHAAAAVVQVEHGREAEIHATGTQLGTQHIAAGGGSGHGGHCAFAGLLLVGAQPELAQRAHGWQVREAIALETLHAAAFVVHADQQIGAQGVDLGAQRRELGAILPVAREQDQPAHERMAQAAAVVVGQQGAGDVEDQGACCIFSFFPRRQSSPRSRSRRSA